MCPRCICPLVMCCLAWGMEPIWKLSGPPAPERMMAGRATEPVSTLPTLLNCCCSTVDLEKEKEEKIDSNAKDRDDENFCWFTPNQVFSICKWLFTVCSISNTHSLFGWHRVFQHGWLFISLQPKVVFALFLLKDSYDVSSDHTGPNKMTFYRQTVVMWHFWICKWERSCKQ